MFIRKAAIGTGLFLSGLFLGVLLGFRSGQTAFMYIDGVPRGVLASMQLSALDKGNSDTARLYLEQDIDQGLFYYSLLNEQWWYPLYTSQLLITASPADVDRYVKRLAVYRAAHPGPKPDPTLFDKVPPGQEGDAAFYKDLAKQHRERLSRIQSVISAHGHQ